MHAVAAAVPNEDPAWRARRSRPKAGPGPEGTGFRHCILAGPIDGTGMPVIVGETKDHAKDAAADPLPPLPRVTARTIETREAYPST